MATTLYIGNTVTMTKKQTPLQMVRKYASRIGAILIDEGAAKWRVSVAHFEPMEAYTTEMMEHDTAICNKVCARAALLGMNVTGRVFSY